MRLNEILNKSQDDLSELADACNAWIALEHSSDQINYILSHPLAKKFNTIRTNEIYRAVFYPYKKFLKSKTAKAKPQPEGFIAYSLKQDWGGSAREDFDYSGDILKFKKAVNGGIILNFSALIADLRQKGTQIDNIDEAEVWMKATPYYTNFTESELLDADLANGKSINGNQKISPAAIAQFKRWVQKGADIENAAEQLKIPPEMIKELLTS